jgi:hypothetical protein
MSTFTAYYPNTLSVEIQGSDLGSTANFDEIIVTLRVSSIYEEGIQDLLCLTKVATHSSVVCTVVGLIGQQKELRAAVEVNGGRSVGLISIGRTYISTNTQSTYYTYTYVF